MQRHNYKFNWYNLTRKSLFNCLWKQRTNVISKKWSSTELHQYLYCLIKKHLPVIVKSCYNKQVDLGAIMVGGKYFSYRDALQRGPFVLIQLYYNPRDSEYNLSLSKYRKLCLDFADTVLHEVIHIRQYRRRNFNSKPDYVSDSNINWRKKEQQYLGNADEIQAYAFNIACELNDKFKSNHEDIIKYLNKTSRVRKCKKYLVWQRYLHAFDYDYNHIVIKKLKKEVIRYLPRAAQGKPYTSKKIDR